MVKYEFCIIKNHIIPIFVDLVALEMIFLQFAEKRVAIFKIRHFEPFLAMGSIPNVVKYEICAIKNPSIPIFTTFLALVMKL